MRTASLSLVVIVLALAAIVAGFLGGQASSHPPAIVVLHASAPPAGVAVNAKNIAALMRHVSDGAVVDPFSDDDVVVERAVAGARNWRVPRLSFIVGLTGNSAIVESQFLRLNVPVAFDVDPAAPDAAAFAKLARANGDALFVHVGSAPTPAQVLALTGRIGSFDGIASHSDDGMARALHGTGMMFFDEEGDAASAPFAKARVALVQRDVTIDDRSSETYISYMLGRAALRARREGRLVVFMRPQPNSLDALNQFLGKGTVEVSRVR
jgi:polysaccharide deacetylase 2 family uncharacterized protein YibQ